MSARDTTPFLKYVARRAMRKGSRVRKLRGTGAKPAMVSMVINGQMRRVWVPGAVVLGAAARLLTPGKLAKLPPKPGKGDRWRLVPVDLIEHLPKQLPPSPFGNIQLQALTEDPLWRALDAVYKQLFELSPIWDVQGAARVELIDNAIDAELKDYKKATSDVGGTKPKKSDKKFYDLERFTDAGQAYVSTPERERARQEQCDAYEAAKEARRQETEEEYAKLVAELSAHAGKLTLQQREAWRMICYEPQLTGKQIAEESGTSEATVTRLRKWFAEKSRRFFELCAPLDYDGAPADAAPDMAIEMLDVTEPEALGAAEVDTKGNAAALNLAADAWAQGLVHGNHSPDTEAEVSGSVLRGYARTRQTANAHQAPHRQQYSKSALMKGSESSGRWTREDQASFEHRQRLRDVNDRPISDDVATAIRELAAKFGLDAEQLLKSAVLRMSLTDASLAMTITGPKSATA